VVRIRIEMAANVTTTCMKFRLLQLDVTLQHYYMMRLYLLIVFT
jgi:hypothetical protein